MIKIKTNLFTILTKFLIVVLPFYVLIKVFFEHKLGIEMFGVLIKELVIVLLFFSLAFEYIREKRLPKFSLLDYLIFCYFGYGIIITLVNGLGLKEIIYGGRYDYLFFVVFLIYRHSKGILKASYKKLLNLGIMSMGVSLIISIIVKYRVGEEALISFGYMSYTSNWVFNGSIPNYHGLEGSGIRRFSGILDSPSAMGFFLLLFTSIFLELQKKKNQFYVYLVIFVLFILILQTYSRAAMLGFIGAGGIIFLINIKEIFKKYRKQLLASIVGFILFFGALGYVFQEKIENIFLRSSSTSGHFSRMEIGLDRFIEKPLGSGLSTSGPAFRNTYEGEINKDIEDYYIPESWFIQQMVEGGIVFIVLFLTILGLISKVLFKKSPIFLAGLVSILIMNFFLHTFEVSYLSILLFLYIGLIVSKD